MILMEIAIRLFFVVIGLFLLDVPASESIAEYAGRVIGVLIIAYALPRGGK